MKITQGFVAAQPDGTFLYISHMQTHTGQHINISPVTDIEHATVRQHPGPRADRKEAAALAELNVTWMPVEVRREVVLLGYGVPSAPPAPPAPPTRFVNDSHPPKEPE